MKLGLIVKVSLLLFAFLGVLFLIKELNSPRIESTAGDSNSVIGLLAGADQRVLNWCPATVQKVEIYKDSGEIFKTLTTKEDISAVCELMIGGFTQRSDQPLNFKLIMKAYPENGNPVSMEQVSSESIFRVQGLPFSSPGLARILERLVSH